MSRIQRLVVLTRAALFVLGSLAPALATEEQGGDDTEEVEETTSTTAWEGEGPAVVIPDAEDAEEDQPWTARFFYPTIVIATVLLIVGVAVGYNRNIRQKYMVTS